MTFLKRPCLPVSSGPIILVYVGETGGFHASPVNNKYIWLREASPLHATHRWERRLQVAAPSTPGFSFGPLHCPGIESCGLHVLSFFYNLLCSVQCCQVLPSSHPVFSSVALLLEELSCVSSTFCELNILLMTVQYCPVPQE
jgi:hypothetical protein